MTLFLFNYFINDIVDVEEVKMLNIGVRKDDDIISVLPYADDI